MGGTPWREKRTFCRIMDTPRDIADKPGELGQIGFAQGQQGGLLIADAISPTKSRMAARRYTGQPSM